MSDLRLLLHDSADRIFRDGFERARHSAPIGGGIDSRLWEDLTQSGLAFAMQPGWIDSGEMTTSDAFSILRAQGFAAGAVPLSETFLGAWLLAPSLKAIPEGALTVAVADGSDLSLTAEASGWRLRGRARRVPWARHAAAVVVLAQTSDGRFVGVIDAETADMEPAANLAGEPRDDMSFDRLIASDDFVPSRWSLEDLRAMGAASRAVQMAGALERVLEMTIAYAQERTQFGKRLGQFQAVQQMLAQMAGQAAAATAAADMALSALAPQPDRFVIAAAKTRAGEAAGVVAALAHQIHGAIGITREHTLNLFTRRLWSWRDEFGNETEWSAHLGRHVMRAGADNVWATITGAAAS